MLRPLLAMARAVDAVTTRIGRWTSWLILATVLTSAGNAVVRKTLHTSSNAALEIQWYLFAAVFMLGAGYAFYRNVHVRIDFISSKLSKRTNAIIDTAGIVIFLIPLCVILIALSWPLFYNAWVSSEMSQNAGGLIRWPVYLLMPLGFGILLLQALSELVKRIAFLKGTLDEPITVEHHKSDEELLLEELAAEAEKKLAGTK
jgi:TRAP-type mannitol/chloroaromatic compound transport system permease small subunit